MKSVINSIFIRVCFLLLDIQGLLGAGSCTIYDRYEDESMYVECECNFSIVASLLIQLDAMHEGGIYFQIINPIDLWQ